MALICGSGALSGLAERLAGVSSADEIDGFKFCPGELFDVSIFRNLWPVFREHLNAERIDFNLPAAYESGVVQPLIDSTYSREQ
jgi:hypothetical protein